MNKKVLIFFFLTYGAIKFASAQKLLAISYKSYQVVQLDTSLSKDQEKVLTEKFMHFIGSVSNDTANLLFYSWDKISRKNS